MNIDLDNKNVLFGLLIEAIILYQYKKLIIRENGYGVYGNSLFYLPYILWWVQGVGWE